MKRFTWILLGILILLTVTYFLSKENELTKTELLTEQMNFRVNDTDKIHKIFLADKSGRKIILTRGADTWYLEDSTKVNPKVLVGLMDIFKNVSIRYIPKQNEIEAMTPTMASKGIKVEVYDDKDNLLMSYYVGGVTSDERGTYFYKEGSDKMYVMELPYQNVSLRTRFFMNANDWKTRLIFDERVEDIQHLIVQYPRSPRHSFEIKQENGDFNINPILTDHLRPITPLKHNVFERYLVDIRGTSFADVVTGVQGMDSITALTPFMDIQLVNTKGDTNSLKLWPKRRFIDQPSDVYNNPNEVWEYYGMDEKGDFGTVQQLTLRGLVAGYKDFFE